MNTEYALTHHWWHIATVWELLLAKTIHNQETASSQIHKISNRNQIYWNIYYRKNCMDQKELKLIRYETMNYNRCELIGIFQDKCNSLSAANTSWSHSIFDTATAEITSHNSAVTSRKWARTVCRSIYGQDKNLSDTSMLCYVKRCSLLSLMPQKLTITYR